MRAKFTGAVVLVALGAVLAGCGGDDDKRTAGCSAQPNTHALVYRVRGSATPATLDATVAKLCERARLAGASVDVRRVGRDRIEIRSAKPLNPELRRSIGSRGRLAFYDWEPNVRPPGNQQPAPTREAAVQIASAQRPRAEAEDVPAGGPSPEVKSRFGGDTSRIEAYYDVQNDSSAAGDAPRGIVVLTGEQTVPRTASPGAWVLEDDSELSGADITNAKQEFDPQTNEPIVSFEFTDIGRAAFARVTKREAVRGANVQLEPGGDRQATLQRFAIALDDSIVSLATIDYIQNPKGISGDSGAQINGLGTIGDTRRIADTLNVGTLPVELDFLSSR